MKINRIWAMPNKNTFEVTPIWDFVDKYLADSERSIDPFARNFQRATITNDMNPETLAQHHEKADVFLQRFVGCKAFDLAIFDPPYSFYQAKEVYSKMGIEKFTMAEAQNMGRWTPEKDMIDQLLKPGGIVLTFGWHSNGMGKKRNYEIIEILLVAHGSAHHDTICMAERKRGNLFE